MNSISLSILSFLLVTAPVTSFADPVTRIVSVNGIYSLTHDNTLKVYPGDVIALAVDQVDSGAALNKDITEFQWTNPDDDSDCYNLPLKRRGWLARVFGSDTKDPCEDSNFESHQYGVNYYVPRDMGQSITIVVKNSEDGTADSIQLINQNPTPVPNVGDQYDDNGNFDYNSSLQSHGRWVYLGGSVRSFVPYGYASGWQPYQNGYWYWSAIYGWTWYSYDPWGWVTDHYGYWRFTADYGWVWIPFTGADYRYHAHCVTFYYWGGYMAWSPYYSGWSSGYNYGYSNGYYHGFLDGYRDGYHSGVITAGGMTSHPHGITVVPNSRFRDRNIRGAVVTDASIRNQWAESVRNNQYGNAVTTREFATERGIDVSEVHETRSQRMGANGQRIEVLRPTQRPDIPAEYRNAQRGIDGISRADGSVSTRPPRLTVGSRVDYDNGVVNTPGSVAQAPRSADGRTVRVPGGQAPQPGTRAVGTPGNPGSPDRVNPGTRRDDGGMSGDRRTTPNYPRTEPRNEPRSQPRPEPRSEPRTMPRSEPRSQPRSEPRTQPRSPGGGGGGMSSPRSPGGSPSRPAGGAGGGSARPGRR